MTGQGYLVDDRSRRELVEALAEIARRAAVPGAAPDTTWADLLFAGGDLADRSERSQALLDAASVLGEGLVDHLNALPRKALVEWLLDRLEIPRLPIVPDRVVAVASGDPKALPVVVPPGTALRGGRDARGDERRYATTESLTVLGATVIDLRSYAVDPAGERAASWVDREAPFVPFPPDASVVHALEIPTDVIRFQGGDLIARVTFGHPSGTVPEGLDWSYSTSSGERAAIVRDTFPDAVVLQLRGSCEAPQGAADPRPYLRAALRPGGGTGAVFAFRFTSISVAVTQREHVRPDAGFFNDGAVDISREFQPFGPVARRGDSFYLLSEEVFAKPLSSLRVNLTLFTEGGALDVVGWGGGVPGYLMTAASAITDEEVIAGPFGGFLALFIGGTGAARIEWQRHVEGRWTTFHETLNELTSASVISPPAGDGGLSEPATVAGVTGRMIRAFLSQGDFGWTGYQSRLARFAAAAATPGASVDPSDLEPPDPPVVSEVTLDYTTSAVVVPLVDLRSVNGWSRVPAETPPITLVRRALDSHPATGRAGQVALGLDVGEAGLGSTVSVYVDVEPAAACGEDGPTAGLAWSYWSSAGMWVHLDVVDGTHGLRQSGLLRFVAPFDWADGSRDVGAEAGRWIRVVDALPERLGTIRAVLPDAVAAAYRVPPAYATDDPTPNVPLRAGELKGLLTPITGIKRLANPLPGIVGRGPELDRRYLGRAAGSVRHRGRAIQAWDYEHLVTDEFPEVAAVRCLPHTGPDGEGAVGSVALVVVPVSTEAMPFPSVTLAEGIRKSLAPRTPLHARIAVLCPLYETVSVRASGILRRGVAAADAKRAIAAAIDAFLHPGPDARFGRELFASTIVTLLEGLPQVDRVTSFALVQAGLAVERVGVDACRGLVASAGRHELTFEEQP
jgi:hypothetical protein